MKYAIDEVTKRLQSEFKLFARDNPNTEGNRATAGAIAILLQELQELTDAIEAKRETLSDWVPDMGLVIWDRDLARWKERLAAYRAALVGVNPRDRAAIAWTVTAPLLLGLYGGPGPTHQAPLDAFTPFTLANQLDEAEAWREERWRLFWEDLREGLEKLPSAVPSWVWAGLGVGVALAFGYALVSSRRSR